LIGAVLNNSISYLSLLKSLSFLSVGVISYQIVTVSGLTIRTLIHFEEQVFPDLLNDLYRNFYELKIALSDGYVV